MGRILVVDDTPFWRNITTDFLRQKGYNIATAGNGVEALQSLQTAGADLIVLDVEMPQLHGLSFLRQIRREERWKTLPVIMLTGDMTKERIMEARTLGATDYLLKARFSPVELLERICKQLGPVASNATGNAKAQPAARNSAIVGEPSSMVVHSAVQTGEFPRLLDRERSLARAEKVMAGRAMAGLIADVISAASSPRTNVAELATLISRDPILSARVLAVGNSGANITARGSISTVNDAVRIVGCAAIRNIATSIGVFDAMPRAESDGFDPIRSWQHSVAVATICDKLAADGSGGSAYLVGLCHDLGKILFRTHFGAEYRQVLQMQKSTGKPLLEVQEKMLGITHGELAQKILEFLGLPPCICRPIAIFHEAVQGQVPLSDPLARALQLADAYAIGMLMASTQTDLVRPFTKAECRAATGQVDPPRPNDAQTRGDIFTMTAMYANFSNRQLQTLVEPLFPQSAARLLVVRDPSLSTFDPLSAALESMADVRIADALPPPAAMADFDGMIVLATKGSTPGFTAADIVASTTNHLPVLWLTTSLENPNMPEESQISHQQWPIALSDLAGFVQRFQKKNAGP
jgi:DNA-binding response OmpR family regulator/HD-like signal output (HDOD) protein